eukprot:429879-Prymnesium_polylepis.1
MTVKATHMRSPASNLEFNILAHSARGVQRHTTRNTRRETRDRRDADVLWWSRDPTLEMGLGGGRIRQSKENRQKTRRRRGWEGSEDL